MKIKRILTTIMSTTLIMSSVLTGCSRPPAEPVSNDATSTTQAENSTNTSEEAVDPVVIYVAAFKGAYGDKFWQEVVSGFEEMYKDKGYKVTLVANEKIEDIVTPQLRNGEGPDVVYLGTNSPSGFAQKLIASGSLLNLTDILDDKVPGEDITLKEKILPGFLDTTSTMPYADGDTFMLPFFYSTNGVFYNKNLFNEDGSNGKYKLPETWDEFLALGEQANADGRKLFIYPKAGYLDQFLIASVASAAGPEVLDQWLKYEDVYENPAFNKVFENLAALKPYFAWDILDPAKPIDNEAKILNNDVLFVPCGSWMPSELADYSKAEGFEYGYMAPPAFDKGGDRYSAGMIEQVYALNTGDKQKEEASKEFLKYLYTDQAVKTIVSNQGGIVPVQGALDMAKEAQVDDVTLELYGVYDKGAKFISGSFVSAKADGVNWKQTYCFSMDSIMQGIEGSDAKWWVERMRADAELMKAGIQGQ
nr:carbohydrate ABC transporter substrate-binding protein [uncultured Niameybacter sp.]